jgi:hypothetical protein
MDRDRWTDPAAVDLAVSMATSLEALTGAFIAEADPTRLTPNALAEALYHAPQALLCHDGAADPSFVYANRTAQALWRMTWEDMVGMPSRLSAEADQRGSRERMLQAASAAGYFSGYRGIRIAANGERFEIRDAVIWTVSTHDGTAIGQAALIPFWRPLHDEVGPAG